MIKELKIRNFRNIAEARLQFSPRVNIFLGQNGQGKTNILESIYLLCSGSSFRYAENSNFIKMGCTESLIQAKAEVNHLDFELGLQILKSKKTHLLNNKKISTAEIIKRFPCVIFSPESLTSIKEGDDERRQLVDDLLMSIKPMNVELITQYRKTLKTRNKILKNFLNAETSKIETENLLESINPIFLKLAAELCYQRVLALRALKPYINSAMQYITHNKNVDISVEYVISSETATDWEQNQIAEKLISRMKQLHDAELASGVSLVGPQKHEIIFLYNQNNSRFYCSQGQQRALILSFKMAQIVYHRNLHGAYPFLLLDDVLSELDAEKRASLIQFLSETNAQIFVTTTDLSLPLSLKSENCAVLNIRDGQIEI